MNELRRKLLEVLGLIVFSQYWLRPVQLGGEEVDPAINFATRYNIWIRLNQETKEGVMNAKEIFAWQGAKDAFRRLEKVVDKIYRGERG